MMRHRASGRSRKPILATLWLSVLTVGLGFATAGCSSSDGDADVSEPGPAPTTRTTLTSPTDVTGVAPHVDHDPDQSYVVGRMVTLDTGRPVPGVVLDVSLEGNRKCLAMSGGDGRFDCPIGEGIDVLGQTVTVEVIYVPVGCGLVDPSDSVRTSEIRTDQNYPVNFDLDCEG
jgi:hypothetical protein